MRTENETNLILTVSLNEFNMILEAANIEDEFIEDYMKDTILREAMIIVKKKEQEKTS